jgi:hypothetical protein
MLKSRVVAAFLFYINDDGYQLDRNFVHFRLSHT